MEYSDNTIIELIMEGNKAAFERMFRSSYKILRAYALTFLKDNDIAEEVLQIVFCRIWEKRHLLKPDGSLKAYLYRAVHNESLNHLKHEKVKASFQLYYTDQVEESDDDASSKMQASELDYHLQQAINELPQQCRIIFQMSRFEQLKYRQIAEQLGLSVKTVENQMGKALKILRLKLVDFLPFILITFFI